MQIKSFRYDTLKKLNKLKDDFSIAVKYCDYEELNGITEQIFSLFKDYLNKCPEDEKIRSTIYALEKTYNEVDLPEFKKQINILTNQLETNYELSMEKKIGQFTQKSPSLKKEMEEWVEEEKELKKQDPEQITRIEKNLSRIAEIIKGE